MITHQDCVALCGRNRCEAEAIAEKDHVSPIVAVQLGGHLCRNSAGALCTRRAILDDIAAAEKYGDHRHVAALKAVLRRFAPTHPQRAEIRATA